MFKIFTFENIIAIVIICTIFGITVDDIKKTVASSVDFAHEHLFTEDNIKTAQKTTEEVLIRFEQEIDGITESEEFTTTIDDIKEVFSKDPNKIEVIIKESDDANINGSENQEEIAKVIKEEKVDDQPIERLDDQKQGEIKFGEMKKL